jgi:hypothetical protein
MTENEKRLLGALAWMCEQYLGRAQNGLLIHDCMSAGQKAVEVLVDYGLVEPLMVVGGKWTESGRAFLNQSTGFD